MALTKIGSIGINTGIAFAGVTTIATLNGSDSVLSVGGTVNFVSDVSIGGTVSIAGTLTYEDVTNVDAVGLITARDGIKVGSGVTLSVDGDIFATGVVTATSFSGSGALLTGVASTENIRTNTNATFLQNINVSGTVTATSYAGSGANLTNLPAANLTGVLPAIDGSNITGVANTDVIFTDKITLPDSAAGSINVGLSSDLQIYHDGSNSYIQDAGTGDLNISGSSDLNLIGQIVRAQASNGETLFRGVEDGAAELYHDNDKKLETASGGVTVTGTVAATSYTGDGSALTGISVGIATTAASMTGITTVLDLSKDDFKVTASGITTVDVRGGTEGDSHTLRIVNSGITTVGFSTYFLFPSGGTPALPTTDGAISLISFTVHRQGAVGLATQLLAGSSVNFS